MGRINTGRVVAPMKNLKAIRHFPLVRQYPSHAMGTDVDLFRRLCPAEATVPIIVFGTNPEPAGLLSPFNLIPVSIHEPINNMTDLIGQQPL